jgi:hypothetical protein
MSLGANRTRVTLEHRHWERMAGPKARDMRDGYNQGWDGVFVQQFGNFAGIATE